MRDTFICTFEIPGPAVAKQSGRMALVGGKPRMFTDTKVSNYQGLVTMCARPHAPHAPLEGAVYVEILALFPRPKDLTKRSVRTGKLLKGDEGRMPYPQKPDCDNAAKAILDGMKSAGMWADDKQATDLTVTKRYVAIGEASRAIVTVRWPIDEDEFDPQPFDPA